MLNVRICVVGFLTLLIFTTSQAQDNTLIWNGDTEELVIFLKSTDDEQITFALQQFILFSDHIKVTRISPFIYEIFRTHKNDNLRQMALVALYKSNHIFMLKNLVDDYYYEKNPKIRRQIAYILDKMPVLKSLN